MSFKSLNCMYSMKGISAIYWFMREMDTEVYSDTLLRMALAIKDVLDTLPVQSQQAFVDTFADAQATTDEYIADEETKRAQRDARIALLHSRIAHQDTHVDPACKSCVVSETSRVDVIMSTAKSLAINMKQESLYKEEQRRAGERKSHQVFGGDPKYQLANLMYIVKGIHSFEDLIGGLPENCHVKTIEAIMLVVKGAVINLGLPRMSRFAESIASTADVLTKALREAVYANASAVYFHQELIRKLHRDQAQDPPKCDKARRSASIRMRAANNELVILQQEKDAYDRQQVDIETRTASNVFGDLIIA